ncbi:MAG: hypothetical protein FWH40_02340 [Coriobacteriia bacterium]|nr:hypothetical protein [Coriobacteriia bacterium]
MVRFKKGLKVFGIAGIALVALVIVAFLFFPDLFEASTKTFIVFTMLTSLVITAGIGILAFYIVKRIAGLFQSISHETDIARQALNFRKILDLQVTPSPSTKGTRSYQCSKCGAVTKITGNQDLICSYCDSPLHDEV